MAIILAITHEKALSYFYRQRKNGPLDHNSLFCFQVREKTVPYGLSFAFSNFKRQRKNSPLWTVFLFETVFFVELVHTSICLSELLTSSVEWV